MGVTTQTWWLCAAGVTQVSGRPHVSTSKTVEQYSFRNLSWSPSAGPFLLLCLWKGWIPRNWVDWIRSKFMYQVQCLPLDDDIIPEAKPGLAVIGFALDVFQRCFHAAYVCTKILPGAVAVLGGMTTWS